MTTLFFFVYLLNFSLYAKLSISMDFSHLLCPLASFCPEFWEVWSTALLGRLSNLWFYFALLRTVSLPTPSHYSLLVFGSDWLYFISLLEAPCAWLDISILFFLHIPPSCQISFGFHFESWSSGSLCLYIFMHVHKIIELHKIIVKYRIK